MFLMLIAGMLLWQEKGPEIREAFRVNYVTLDIVATKRNKPVTDLIAEDFKITENGVEVTPNFFQILDYRNAGAAPDKTDENGELIEEKPLQEIIIALDFESVVRKDVHSAFREIRDFLYSLDRAYRHRLNLFILERGSLTKGFTEDLDDVLDALQGYQDRFFSQRYRTSKWDSDNPLFGEAPQGQGMRANSGALIEDVNDINSLAEALAQCSFLGRSAACRCISNTANDFMEEQKYRTERVVGELENLAYTFSDDTKLKTMMLLSPGFSLQRLRSVETMVRNAFRTSSDCRDNVFGLGRVESDADFQRVTHACIRNRVMFHTFDIFNTLPSGQMRASYGDTSGRILNDYSREMASGLRKLAEESGGTFHQVRRLEGAMNRVLDRNDYIYVLGYTSPPGPSGEYRKIKVKTNRRGVKLRHRRGYYGR
jgi:VWFA-related protein